MNVKTFNNFEELMDLAEVEEKLNISYKTLGRWIADGKFPPPIRFNRTPNAKQYWERRLVNAWYEDQKPRDKFRFRYLKKGELT